MKKILSLAVAAAMALSCTALAFAAENGEPSKSPTGGNDSYITEVVVLTAEDLAQYYVSDEVMQAAMQARASAMAQEPVMLTTLTQSATGKDDGYEFDEIIVLDEDDIMALSDLSNFALNPHTLYILKNDQITARRVTLTVHYLPTYLYMYFGVATSDNPDTAWYYSNEATGGYGSAIFVNQQPGTYFPYIGNTTDQVINVDFSCVAS